MRRALAILFVAALATPVGAQPITGGGLQKVNHASELTGTGTNALPLGLKTTCGSGQVLAFVSSVWTCTTVGSILGGGATNTISKWTSGTAVGNSSMTDDGTTVTTAEDVVIGHMKFSPTHSTIGTFINGGATTDTANVLIDDQVTPHTAYETIGLWINEHGTYDTTGQVSTAYGMVINVTTQKTVGANAFHKVGILCNVDSAGATDNLCLQSVTGNGGLGIADPSTFGDLHTTSVFDSVGDLTVGPYQGTAVFKVTASSGDVKIPTNAYITQATTAVAGRNVLSGLTLIGGESASNNLYISTNSLSGEYESNATDNLVFNFAGYHGGTTQFRGIRIFDGKNVEYVKFQGDTHHIITLGPAVSFSAGAGCGTSPACNSGTCDDIAGTFTTGSATTACTITFNGTYTTAANHSCIFTPIGTGTYPTLGAGTATTAVLSTAIASTQYSYICLGH